MFPATYITLPWKFFQLLTLTTLPFELQLFSFKAGTWQMAIFYFVFQTVMIKMKDRNLQTLIIFKDISNHTTVEFLSHLPTLPRTHLLRSCLNSVGELGQKHTTLVLSLLFIYVLFWVSVRQLCCPHRWDKQANLAEQSVRARARHLLAQAVAPELPDVDFSSHAWQFLAIDQFLTFLTQFHTAIN